MAKNHRIKTVCLFIMIWGMLFTFFTFRAAATDLGTPHLYEPLQKEKFFNPQRLSIESSSGAAKHLLEPQFSVSHDARESDMGGGVKQTRYRLHGEAGGKLNLLGDVSLITVARIPVYTHESTGSERTADGTTASEFFKNTGRLSWRSELGVPLKKGVNLNFFYDNSTLGRVVRPGVDEREEKFGTRFIFNFK